MTPRCLLSAAVAGFQNSGPLSPRKRTAASPTVKTNSKMIWLRAERFPACQTKECKISLPVLMEEIVLPNGVSLFNKRCHRRLPEQ